MSCKQYSKDGRYDKYHIDRYESINLSFHIDIDDKYNKNDKNDKQYKMTIFKPICTILEPFLPYLDHVRAISVILVIKNDKLIILK